VVEQLDSLRDSAGEKYKHERRRKGKTIGGEKEGWGSAEGGELTGGARSAAVVRRAISSFRRCLAWDEERGSGEELLGYL
jgi:hypothetical protein